MNRMSELDFVQQIHLRNRKKHSKGFNYSCNVCMDKKKRAYLMIYPTQIILYCHNCNSSLSLRKYIELHEPSLFEEYKAIEKKEFLESLKEGTLSSKKIEYHTTINTDIKDLTLFKFNTKYFIPATENKECVEYCKKRKIPDEIVAKLKYCTNPKSICGGMLIFPCYWKDGEHVYAFQGRSLTEKRFYIHSKNDSFKVAGLFQVDLTKPVYIFESIIDSYSMNNSIAMMGADLSSSVLKMIEKPVFIFDSDDTGIKKAYDYATRGYKVFVPPTELRKYKDFNAVLMSGFKHDTLLRIVRDNICEGFSAIARLKIIQSTRKKKKSPIR